jgi:Flp pilus assembly protein TadD
MMAGLMLLCLGIPPQVTAETISPAARQAFTNGLDHLGANRLESALEDWRQFLTLHPEGKSATTVRGYVTLLTRTVARREAKRLATQSDSATATPTDPRTVAVLNFKNLTNGHPFHKSIATMVATDLAQVPELRVVERLRIHVLLEELKLSTSGLVDANSAPRVGRLLHAGSNVTGAVFDDPSTEDHHIAATLTRTAPPDTLATPEAKGKRTTFFDLEKQIVYQLLEGLGIVEIPEEAKKIHTKNWEAHTAFTIGLHHLDNEDYAAARAAFSQAVALDTNFELARKHMHAMPAQKLSLEEMAHQARHLIRQPRKKQHAPPPRHPITESLLLNPYEIVVKPSVVGIPGMTVEYLFDH